MPDPGLFAVAGPRELTWNWSAAPDGWALFGCAWEDCRADPRERLSLYRGGIVFSVLLLCAGHAKEIRAGIGPKGLLVQLTMEAATVMWAPSR